MRLGGSSSWRTAALTAALGALSSGCVESGTYEQATTQVLNARVAVAQKDVQIRAYEWQLATLTQQLREWQQRAEVRDREREAQIQQLTATNASLAERVKQIEQERADLLKAESAQAADPRTPGREPRGLRPDEVRRLMAAAEARNLQILEELARIQRSLGSRPPPNPPDGGGARASDVMDPWGFGSRK